MIRRLAALSAVVACLFAASACSSDSSKDSTPAASNVPSYANNPGDQGAEQFVSYWIDTLNKATVTGKTDKFKSLGFKSCTRCTDFASQLDTIYADGGHVDTAGWSIDKIVPESGLPQGQTGISVKLKVAPQTVVKKKGAAPEKLKGGDLRIRLLLMRPENVWRVASLDIG